MEEVLSSQDSSLSHFLSPLSFELFLSHSVAAVPVQQQQLQQQLEQPGSAAVIVLQVLQPASGKRSGKSR